MRTFVFISNIPPFLLQPLHKGGEADGTAGSARRASKFDPRYERLRRLLVEQSSGVMLVMHLESAGYALALYASEKEAIAACKADIVPEQPGHRYTPLRLRIVEKEKPRPVEPVYNPVIEVEGEKVQKTDLADSRGLELVYRGRAVAKWCPHTLDGEDCYFGVSCLKIHKAVFQRTVRKRPRVEDEEGTSHLAPEQRAVVKSTLASVKRSRETLIPPSLQLQPCVYIPLSTTEAAALCRLASMPAEVAEKETAFVTLRTRATAALEAFQQEHRDNTSAAALLHGSFFARLTCQGGSPVDWSITSEEGRRLLRRCCPLPPNGAPTPLERDLYLQQLVYNMNQLNRCETIAQALHMLRCSRRVCEAVAEEEGKKDMPQLFISLEPWLYLPTVGCEVSVMFEHGGRRVRGAVQRYGQLRLMTSSSLLRDVQAVDKGTVESKSGNAKTGCPQRDELVAAALSRFAVIGTQGDPEAEEHLEKELRLFQRVISRAVSELGLYLERQIPTIGITDGGSWCAQLAVVTSPEPNTTAAAPSVVVLSFPPYQKALEECVMYNQLAPASTEAPESRKAAEKVEVIWNTQRHPYVSLLSRELLEKLSVGPVS